MVRGNIFRHLKPEEVYLVLEKRAWRRTWKLLFFLQPDKREISSYIADGFESIHGNMVPVV